MKYVLDALGIICCAVIVYQDFRERKVSAWLLIVLSVALFLQTSLSSSVGTALENTLVNTLFVLFLLVTLTAYFSLRARRFVNIVDTYLGLGDILLLLGISSCFPLFNFVLYFTLSLLLTLGGILILKLLRISSKAEIPLAGALAITLGTLLAVSDLIDFSLNRNWIEGILPQHI
jgi:hypothetical protein